MSAPARLPLRALAPAKINLGLFVGPIAADGRHQLVTVIQAVSLADELTLEWLGGDLESDGTRARVPSDSGSGTTRDEVVCPGVSGPPSQNLAARALAAFRDSTGWHGPPVRLSINKRVPVAAGLGGGSADAATALRLMAAVAGQSSPDSDARLQRLAAGLGSDVPALVRPGRWLVTGTGERLELLADPARALGVVVLPADAPLGTADVYARADRLSPPRPLDALATLSGALRVAFADGAPLAPRALLVNDLEAAARSLCPAIDEALRQLRTAGSDMAFVSGSGPTVVGLFCGDDGAGRAQRAAAALSERVPAPIAASTADAELGLPRPLLSF